MGGAHHMSTATNIAKKAVQDKIESQIKIVQAKLETLKAKAETGKATAELKAITELVTKKQTIDRKLTELKQSGEASYDQARADIESHISELEKSLQSIEAKFRAA